MREKWIGKLRQFGPPLMGVFVLLLLVHDILGTHGYLEMRQKRLEIQKINAEIDRLNKENAELQQNVQDLKSDPQTIKKIAREELGLAEAGEVIIRMPAPKQVPPPAVKP